MTATGNGGAGRPCPAPPGPGTGAEDATARTGPSRLRRTLRALDLYVVALALTVGLAAVLPATGRAADATAAASGFAVALLFFLYGARLSTRETLAGLRHVKLHAMVLASTFVMFPLLGLALAGAVSGFWPGPLYAGVLFLCVVPSTVQSSVALTSVARGDVPAAICAGTYSSLVGLVATPLLATWLIGESAPLSADGLLRLGGQLLAPFVAGQLLRRWIGGFVVRHKRVFGPVDRGSILLVVYTAFSTGMTQGVWGRITVSALLVLVAALLLLFVVALLLTRGAARLLGLGRESRIAAVLCGSQKSLATGLPMAAVLFGDRAALTVLPLMIYHQLQLLVCAALARRWARPAPEEAPGAQPVAAATPG
ncbi:bile acid:sodium symporter family protein [uncultured Streptomyces sp.]|uniref:bile acid:sodium symporter family protein n=1 Tax=uncultured Streptomyces sp. TaxID=174707 RepID=UPI002616D374|nr:bile acid:sodium symporter family protein [uncultured Streptomyces sp.]